MSKERTPLNFFFIFAAFWGFGPANGKLKLLSKSSTKLVDMPSSFAWSRDGENVAVSLIRCDCEREISIDSDGESNGDAGASSSLGKSSGK